MKICKHDFQTIKEDAVAGIYFEHTSIIECTKCGFKKQRYVFVGALREELKETIIFDPTK